MLYEVFEHNEIGYKTLMHFNNWRVAMLNYIFDCSLEHLSYLEAHLKTDEAFILLEGSATLILADVVADKIISIEKVVLEKNKIYNIKQGTYHTQILSMDAKVLLVEEKDTGDSNSVRLYLDTNDLNKIKEAL